MGTPDRGAKGEWPAPLLKTCQTCFHAKIKCQKTQHPDMCDRCLRLGKTCVFNPARRRHNVSRQRRTDRLEVRARRESRSPSGTQSSSTRIPGNSSINDVSFDSFYQGMVSLEEGQVLFDYFSTKMVSYFPFVVVRSGSQVADLHTDRPCVCLAALAAASRANTRTQKVFGNLFNQLVASRMVSGDFHDLDLLQGLLVHLAWAHYQPRPKRYTQHLHLATSIVSDMRLDRPRRPKLWEVHGGKDRDEPDWGADEMRALVGVYYLSSSSSVLLQKSRHFTYTPYIMECCERLALMNQHSTDKHLADIIRIQRLTEETEEALNKANSTIDGSLFVTERREVARKHAEVKASLSFALSDSPPLLLHLHMLELLLSQSSPQGTLFGLDKFHDPKLWEDDSSLIDWLSSSISSVRSLIGVVLVLPEGLEAAMSNLGWIMVYCGLSLAVRLDLILASGRLKSSAEHLRRFLDMPHTLRQIVLRMGTAAASQANGTDDSSPFSGLARRVRRLEAWYVEQAQRFQEESTTGNYVSDLPILAAGEETRVTAGSAPGQLADPGSSAWYQGSELDFGTFLFPDHVEFPIGIAPWSLN